MGRPPGSKNRPKEEPMSEQVSPERAEVMTDDEIAALLPDIRVIERRLQNPEGVGDVPILLTNVPRPMVTRWFNEDLGNGRIFRAINYLGWVAVPRRCLADENQLAGLTDMGDGNVRRGERGREWLMMMPKDTYDLVQGRKAENRRKKNRPAQVREDMAQAAANTLGDESADMLMGTHPNKNVTVFGDVSTSGPGE